ncbi:MAG: hypothetical protein ACLRZ9_05835 [Eubacterium sp.]
MKVEKLEEIKIINKDGHLEAYINGEEIDISKAVSLSLELRIEEDENYFEVFTKNREAILVRDFKY